MQKQVPTVGRLLVMAVFTLSCFGLLLYLWSAFGGPVPLKPHGYRFHAHFAEATQLAQEADVRISGVNVGKVKKIDLGSDGRTDATIARGLRDQHHPADAAAAARGHSAEPVAGQPRRALEQLQPVLQRPGPS